MKIGDYPHLDRLLLFDIVPANITELSRELEQFVKDTASELHDLRTEVRKYESAKG
jgi:hypothetical protein